MKAIPRSWVKELRNLSMGISVAAESRFERSIRIPDERGPCATYAGVVLEDLEGKGVHDIQLQTCGQSVHDGVVDVSIAEAVPDDHQPGRRPEQHLAKLVVVPSQDRVTP